MLYFYMVAVKSNNNLVENGFHSTSWFYVLQIDVFVSKVLLKQREVSSNIKHP